MRECGNAGMRECENAGIVRGAPLACRVPFTANPRLSHRLLQRVLHEEPHELDAGGEGVGGLVAVVTVLGAAGPGVPAAFDGEERDFGAAARETDLVDGGGGMTCPG